MLMYRRISLRVSSLATFSFATVGLVWGFAGVIDKCDVFDFMPLLSCTFWWAFTCAPPRATLHVCHQLLQARFGSDTVFMSNL